MTDYGQKQDEKKRLGAAGAVVVLLLGIGAYFSSRYLSGALFSIYLIDAGEGLPWQPDGLVFPFASHFVAGPVACGAFWIVGALSVTVSRHVGEMGLKLLRTFLFAVGVGISASVVAFLAFSY